MDNDYWSCCCSCRPVIFCFRRLQRDAFTHKIFGIHQYFNNQYWRGRRRPAPNYVKLWSLLVLIFGPQISVCYRAMLGFIHKKPNFRIFLWEFCVSLCFPFDIVKKNVFLIYSRLQLYEFVNSEFNLSAGAAL